MSGAALASRLGRRTHAAEAALCVVRGKVVLSSTLTLTSGLGVGYPTQNQV
jgi:hypothetical protein